MLEQNFVKTLETSLNDNWELPAFSDYGGETKSYEEVALAILRLHYIFREAKIKKGDKIALVGRNASNWAIVYFATVSYGAVIVPIMPDFHADDIHHIVNHSDSELLFASGQILEKLDSANMNELKGVLNIDDFSIHCCAKKNLEQALEAVDDEYLEDYEKELRPGDLRFPEIDNKELAAIIYTSGTTGFSKGVMLPHNSLMGNVLFAQNNLPLVAGDRMVSFLPIAHSYGCAFDMLYPFATGCHITFLGRIPSPRILLEAFAEIRPRLIMAVPLILEKIYRKQLKPKLDKLVVRGLRKIPLVEKKLLGVFRKKLVKAFGGNFVELVIGGAALNREVEDFFKRIQFPLTIGYGMTECGPLISYTAWDKHRLGSIGQPLAGLMEVKIDSPDPESVVGEIMTRGEHVMYGYYKNKKATQAVLDKDGWLRTGDLGQIDSDNFIYIKGRSKTMLLGAAGENVYPEEIEAKLNNFPYVSESLIIQRDHKFVALVYPDMELADAEGVSQDELVPIMEENRKALNAQLPKFSAISRVELYPEEFEKTPKKSIKRFLYTH